MKLDAELQKPLILQGGQALTLAQARTAIPQTGAHRLASRPTKDLNILVAERALANLRRQSPHQLRELIIQRLRAIPTAEFRFLDGTVSTGEQAADEVARGTRKGEFFFSLEQRTLRIVLDLIKSGDHVV